MNVYFKIFLILLLNYTLIFGKDNQEDDKELISSSLKSYFSEVDEKDFESMLDYIKLPFILNFESKEPLNLKSEEEFIEVFELWSKSEKANYYETILDSVSYTEIHKNFMWVVDVTYSRVRKKSKSKETNRSLYYFMKKEDFWKIYMVSSIAFD